MFSGTQEKCAVCGKTAYPLEKVGSLFPLDGDMDSDVLFIWLNGFDARFD